MTTNTENRSPIILVTGATGAIGPRVVEALHQVGYQIRSFSIDTPAPGVFPPDVEVIIGDVMNKEDVESAMFRVEAVVHMAALLHIVNPPPEMREIYERINVGGTANVVEAAIQAGVRRLVLFSTIAVYGDSTGAILTEESPCNPDSFYAQTKLAAERIVLAARRPDGMLGTVLRLGAVYGARIKGNYRRLLLALARGRFVPIGPGTNRRTLVYDKDVARAALLAVTHPDAAGRIFNVTDGHFHTLDTIIGTLCDALDRRPPRLVLPVGPVRRLAGLLDGCAQACGLRSLGRLRATVDKYTEDVAVDGQRICTEIGFVPQFDLASGWRETVAEMRISGDL